MKIIWDRGESTITDVFKAVNAGRHEPVRRTTVQVQMNRLTKYGWLRRRKTGLSYSYSAATGRQKTRKAILADIRDRVFGGSRSDLVRCLLEDGSVSSDEIKTLKKLITDMEKNKR
ncbi:MAG: BlaI/MecI/CopY family transcriptional regulator [Candidatus Aminicenantes bacterium]|nr:BlaI/MecI/CopY family transcriptional regulator [Candidatus Aminicenantes bacterium]